MNEIEDNYLQKFYRRNTNLSELTAIKNMTHKSSLHFLELDQKEIIFLWVLSNILLHTF